MRVGIISLIHESNTFLSSPTTLEDFQMSSLDFGQDMRAKWQDSHHEVGGFFEGIDKAGFEAVPLMGAWATPSGAITDETRDVLLEMMWQQLDDAGQLDGLLVAPHGAAVSVSEPDMDGYWLSRLRERVGDDMPIMCTLDPHVNLTQRMVDSVTATVVYRSNPHLDQRQRGLEAANLLVRTLKGEIKPTQACALPPIAINIERQFTDDPPCRPMYAFADEMLKQPGVLSNSIVLGFPYADVVEMGSAFVVVTDNDPALAQKLADELSDYLHEHRHEFIGQLVEVDDAIDQAIANGKPTCLLDMGDNVGGGSAADGTFIAHAFHDRKLSDVRALVALADAEAQEQARAAGVGAKLELTVGGKTDDKHGKPLTAEFTVVSLHDGKFGEKQPRHGGKTVYNMGPTAIVQTATGLTVQLASRRTPPFSLGQLTSCDIELSQYQIIVAKGVNAPVAAYEPVCEDRMIRVNTDGVTTADMNKLNYKHRRKPLFPFEEV